MSIDDVDRAYRPGCAAHWINVGPFQQFSLEDHLGGAQQVRAGNHGEAVGLEDANEFLERDRHFMRVQVFDIVRRKYCVDAGVGQGRHVGHAADNVRRNRRVDIESQFAPMRGLKSGAGPGPLSYEAQRGMYLHPTYAVTPDREPLGMPDAWMWAREKRGKDGVRPGLKESRRWVEGYERFAGQAATLPGTRLVYLADREADMVEMMRVARDLGTPADWPVRAKHDRCLAGDDGTKRWAATTNGTPHGEISFAMGGREKQEAREVRQQLWAQRVLIGDGKKEQIEATCIVAREVEPPVGVQPVEWRLLTNRSANTLEQATLLIDW